MTVSIGPPLMPPKSKFSGGVPPPRTAIRFSRSINVETSVSLTLLATPPPGAAPKEISLGDNQIVSVPGNPE
jgi:hypothetical protein